MSFCPERVKEDVDNELANDDEYGYIYFKSSEEQECAADYLESLGYFVEYCSDGDDLGVEYTKPDEEPNEELGEALKTLEKAGLICETAYGAKPVWKKHGHGIRHAGYTFSSPKVNGSYVRILKALFMAPEKTLSKREIYDALGWEYSHGNRSGIFISLADEGLVSYDRATNKWTLTEMGENYIRDNKEIFTATADGAV